MKITLPHDRAEARALITRLGDYIDGTPDAYFDAKTVAKRAGAAIADDFKENVFIAIGTIVLWELGWFLARHLL